MKNLRQNRENRFLQQRILFFQTRVSDIKFAKEQQWRVLYLTVIAIAGIYAFTSTIGNGALLGFSFFLTCIITAIGLYLIGKFGRKLQEYRSYLDELFDLLDDDIGKEKFYYEKSNEKDQDIVKFNLLFSGIILVTFLICNIELILKFFPKAYLFPGFIFSILLIGAFCIKKCTKNCKDGQDC